jgi:hypothetical protein
MRTAPGSSARSIQRNRRSPSVYVILVRAFPNSVASALRNFAPSAANWACPLNAICRLPPNIPCRFMPKPPVRRRGSPKTAARFYRLLPLLRRGAGHDALRRCSPFAETYNKLQPPLQNPSSIERNVPLSDQVADAPTPSGQCRSCVDPCPWRKSALARETDLLPRSPNRRPGDLPDSQQNPKSRPTRRL